MPRTKIKKSSRISSTPSGFPYFNYLLKPFTDSIHLLGTLPTALKDHRKKEIRKNFVELSKLPKRLTQKETESTLKNSINDGIAASIMVGAGESSISPFAIAMNASNAQIAMLTSIPNLIAPSLQLQTPKKLEKASRKSLILKAVLMQTLMLIPIALLALIFLFKLAKFIPLAPWLLIIFFTLYVIFGTMYGPAWASWMGDVVPERQRYSFFAKRNAICGATALIANLFAGIFLDWWPAGLVFIGFMILFVISMIARLISRSYIIKKKEPRLKLSKGYYFSFFDFIKRIKENNFGRFVIYVAAIILATNIAGPFFAVYMLRDLKFSYTIFTIINLTASLSTLIAFKHWGRYSEKYGNIKMLKFCGLYLVPALPLLWLVSHNFWWLIGVQLLGGVAWAGFNLAAGNFIYDSVTPQRRSLCVAYQAVINGLAVFAGASIGGLLATRLNVGINILLFVFLVSGLLRFLFSVFMLPGIKGVKKLKNGRLVISDR